MTDKQRKICEDLGWEIEEDGKKITFSQHSPLNEDFSFTISGYDIVEEVRTYQQDFDPELHTVMWFGLSKEIPCVSTGLRDLLDDADAINKMLDDLATALEKAEDEPKKIWKIVPASSGVKQDFMSGFASEYEAEEFAEKHGWVWLDENQFEWRMEIEEDD